jgi:hypothetical protein
LLRGKLGLSQRLKRSTLCGIGCADERQGDKLSNAALMESDRKNVLKALSGGVINFPAEERSKIPSRKRTD